MAATKSHNVRVPERATTGQFVAAQKLAKRNQITLHSARKGTPPGVQCQVPKLYSPGKSEHRRWMGFLNVRKSEVTAADLGGEDPAQKQRGKGMREIAAAARSPDAKSQELREMLRLQVPLLETTNPISPCFVQKLQSPNL